MTLLLLTGCYYPLTDEQKMKAVKQCEDAGYGVTVYKTGWDDATVRIECDFAKGKVK
jgi:hypothetical protein